MNRLLIALAVLGALVGLLALDRLLLLLERRGWIYYRKKKPSPATLGGALLQVQSLLEPEKAHQAIVLRQQVKQPRDGGSSPQR